ncbi:translation initiation factor IF-3 [bacterium]|nr:translation initiation factor IF-3 [bacterium]
MFVLIWSGSYKLNIGDKTIANDNRSKDRVIMNAQIRSREVRLIDENGENHGVVQTSKALKMAEEADLDLVLISPNQAPPVAKILDYGKYKYEQTKKAKEAKKKQHIVEIKEVKMRYKIDVHDYEVRLKSAKKFISQGNKVKVVVMLRGREMQHSNLAFDLANRFIEDIKSAGGIQVEKKPSFEGRNVTCYLTAQN